MDADRFDTLVRSLSAPRSRRAALSAAAAGGLLSALGLGRAVPEARAAQGGTCVAAFAANAGRAGEVQGNLSFSLSARGNLDNATLTLPDGTSLPVVGQATGHSLQLRIALGPQRALVAVGVGEQEISRCQGAIDGVVSGPRSGDLGDWHAAAGVQNVPTGGGEQGTDRGGGGGSTGGGGASGGGSSGGGSSGGGTGGTQGGSGGGGTAGSSSSSNAPSCPAGETYCTYVEECRDLRTSPLDCGACATRCPSLVCQEGRCLSEEEADSRGSTGLDCDPGETICDGLCVYLPTDPSNCGACGNACDFNVASCQDGTCVFRPDENCPTGQIQCGATCCDACPSGTVNCGSDPPLCVDLLTDPSYCGLCGIVCAPGEICQGGACVASGGGGCKDGSLTFCSGVCVDLNDDPANCGGCGVACAAGEICQFGTCTTTTTEAPPPPTCGDQGLIECFGVCVDLQTDPNNCGYCGEVCPSGQCSTGICIEVVGPAPAEVVCPQGQADCGGGCIDVFSDPANCGFCGNVCAADATCFLGGCVTPPDLGL